MIILIIKCQFGHIGKAVPSANRYSGLRATFQGILRRLVFTWPPSHPPWAVELMQWTRAQAAHASAALR